MDEDKEFTDLVEEWYELLRDFARSAESALSRLSNVEASKALAIRLANIENCLLKLGVDKEE